MNGDYNLNSSEKFLARWSAPEYEVYEMDRRRNSYIAIVLLAIIAYAVWTDSPVMAITFVLIGVVGYIFFNREPQTINFAITRDGVVAGREIYEFENIKSFWIFYEPGEKKVISLSVKSNLLPYAHIPIPEEDPVAIREILLAYIPEIKQEKNIVDTFERIIGM